MQTLLRILAISICLGILIGSSGVSTPVTSQVANNANLCKAKPIYTADDLLSIGREVSFPLDGVYRLENDIKLDWADFKGIGSEKEPFEGTLYGNGHNIIQLLIKNNSDYTGLFRVLGKQALIQGLKIQAANVQGRSHTGLLAGYNQGIIKDCYVEGNIIGTSEVGGLVGINGHTGKIYHSKAIGAVKGLYYEIGGLVGSNLGYVIDSRSQAYVTGIRLVGGLVGSNEETGQILHCVALGRVSGKGWIGGLVGHNWFRGQISHCIANAIVVGEEYVGGLAGANYAQACITKSSSVSLVQGEGSVGMVVGANRGKISYGLDMEDSWGDGNKISQGND